MSIVGKKPSKKASDVSLYNSKSGGMCMFNECRDKFEGKVVTGKKYSKHFEVDMTYPAEAYVCADCGREYVTRVVSNTNYKEFLHIERSVACGAITIEQASCGSQGGCK